MTLTTMFVCVFGTIGYYRGTLVPDRYYLLEPHQRGFGISVLIDTEKIYFPNTTQFIFKFMYQPFNIFILYFNLDSCSYYFSNL